jgi:tetratricopeptide (TPR) repeat protein
MTQPRQPGTSAPHEPAAATTPRASRLPGSLLLIALVGLSVLRSSVGTQLDSFTVDEPWHIVAGTAYVRSGDFNLNPEHPPLVKLWAGAAMGDDFRLRPAHVLSEKAQERTWVEQTMFADNDARLAQQRARVAMWGFHAALLLLLGCLLWHACGLTWAAGTLAFLAIEPTVGAHLPVVMTDLPLALTLMIAAVCGGLLAARWQWRWAIACGLAIGLALGSKHSALAGLGGLGLLLLAATHGGWRSGGWSEVARRQLRLLACAALAVLVLWALYGFRFHAGLDGSDAFNRPMAEKIAELKLANWREGIALADRFQLLPRAWLWGLADTVRTGVEGRGIAMHFVWGTPYMGAPPWFAWPAILASKLPLALIALAALGSVLLWRTRLPPSARWTLLAVLAACVVHFGALIGSGGIWGGVRHALPLIAGAAMLAGAAIALAWQRRSVPLIAVAAGLLAAAVTTTMREPRLWEYHNELVGGSANAYRYFGNEGLDLGQRFAEIRAFHDRHIAPGGQPLYSDYWMGEEQVRAAGLAYRRRVESLDDTNVEGRYEGWFIYPMQDTLPWPQWEWDPAEVFAHLELVQRMGHVGIWKGYQVRPRTRASSLYYKVSDYIYKEGGEDWALVARRLEEVAALLPQKVDAGIELGNAYLRLGEGDRAIVAYRRLLEQDQVPVDALVRADLERQIARIAGGGDLAQVEPMRNPWLE